MDISWTPALQILGGALLMGIFAIILLPMVIRWIDEQLGYMVFLIGAVLLWLALHLGVVRFEGGSFVQSMIAGRREDLHILLLESWILIVSYFSLSLLASFLRRSIAKAVWKCTRHLQPHTLIFLWMLTAGSLGSLSIVVMAVVGAIFFSTLQEITRRDYTPCVVIYAAAIGLSALLSTVGEPLSLFIARALGDGSVYLVRTFGGMYAINIVCLALTSAFVARRARPLPESTEQRMVQDVERAERAIAGDLEGGEVGQALRTVEEFERETHDFSHVIDQTLHSTVKLYLFVVGLLFLGQASKPIAALLFARLSPAAAFFGNAISAVADNALLGLLEIQPGMPQSLVLVLGFSLALWGVALVPGNVCNVVLKEKLKIPFRRWAQVGIPCALGLAALNFAIIESGLGRWLMF